MEIGAVLCQEQDGETRVIVFACRPVRWSEQNYSTYKPEFLALCWAVAQKIHDYLYEHKFTVTIDYNPLTDILTTAKLDATGHRWLADLGAYDFDVNYKPGKANVDADILSRLPCSKPGYMSLDVVQDLRKVGMI